LPDRTQRAAACVPDHEKKFRACALDDRRRWHSSPLTVGGRSLQAGRSTFPSALAVRFQQPIIHRFTRRGWHLARTSFRRLSRNLAAAVPDFDCAAVISRRKDRHRFLPSLVIVGAFEHFY
jgi:hypothetical protein